MATTTRNPERTSDLAHQEKGNGLGVAPAVRAVRADTRSAIRHLFIFVGGTGLETLDAMSPVLKAHGIRFGDEGLADSHGIVPHAIFVDTNTQETRVVSAADDMDPAQRQKLEREGKLVRDAQGIGVQVCNLYERNDALKAKLRRLGISQSDMTTADSTLSTDSCGAKTDTRISRLLNLAKRKAKNDPNNSITVVRETGNGWREPHKKPLDNTVFLTVVGGAHGGTGPLALPILFDARQALLDVLSGTKSGLISERFIMTSESAGIDESVKRDEHEQRRRMRNTAMTAIASNYAFYTGKYAFTPTEYVPIKLSEASKHYEFIIGGDNGAHHVSSKGGHYEPAQVIGKFLASRLIAGDPTSGLRSGIDRYLETGREPKKCVPKGMTRGFSSLGVSELVPDPERRVLSKAKKQLLFAQAVGIKVPEDVLQYAQSASLTQDIAQKQANKTNHLKALFPENDLSAKKDELKTASSDQGLRMKAQHYYDAQSSVEDAINAARRKRENKIDVLTTRLDTVISALMRSHFGRLMEGIMDAVNSLKNQHGLTTAKEFLEDAIGKLTALAVESSSNAVAAANDETVRNKESASIVSDIENIKLPEGLKATYESAVSAIGFANPQKTRQTNISSKLDDLAASDNQLLACRSENMYCTLLARMISTNAVPAVNRCIQDLRLQQSQAEEILATIGADPETTVVSTPFDTPTEVDMQIDVGQADAIRSKFLQRNEMKDGYDAGKDGDPYIWHKDDIRSVAAAQEIRFQPDDINLTSLLSGPGGANLLQALETDSMPLSCSASKALKGQSPGHEHPIVMVTKPAKDKASMANIPSPPSGGTEVRVPPDSAYSIIREHHAFGLLDDRYLRECVELLLATPPTLAEAAQFAESLSDADGSELDLANREEYGLLRGEVQQLCAPVFEALAKKQLREADEIGDTPRCINKNCGVMFFRTPEEKEAALKHCPGCRGAVTA